MAKRLLHVQGTQRSIKNYKRTKLCIERHNNFVNSRVEMLLVMPYARGQSNKLLNIANN